MKKKTSKTKKNSRNLNLDEKIYYLCAIKPQCETDINDILHQSKKSSCSYLSVKFTELKHRGWIVKDSTYKPESLKNEKDQRKLKREFYRANPQLVLDRIKERVQLDNFEEYILLDKLNSTFLNIYLEENIPSGNPFEYIISKLDFLLIMIDENIGLKELNLYLSKNIETKQQYKNMKKKIRNEFTHLTKIFSDQSLNNSELNKNLLDFLVFPDLLFNRIMRISDRGKDYYQMRTILRSFSEISNKIVIDRLIK